MLVLVLFRLLLVLSAVTNTLAASTPRFPSYQYNSHTLHFHKRQNRFQNQTLGYYPVTGVLDRGLDNGSLPVRREIRELEKDQDLWTLYLLGLDAMQASEQAEPTSWYKIMGKLTILQMSPSRQTL